MGGPPRRKVARPAVGAPGFLAVLRLMSAGGGGMKQVERAGPVTGVEGDPDPNRSRVQNMMGSHRPLYLVREPVEELRNLARPIGRNDTAELRGREMIESGAFRQEFPNPISGRNFEGNCGETSQCAR